LADPHTTQGARSTRSADTALRLSRYSGTSERFWMNLQVCYDLEVERPRVVIVSTWSAGTTAE
jgi:plasmid maintenance system antidote protein VapI